MSKGDDNSGQLLVVLLLLLVVGAVAYNLVVSAKVAQALQRATGAANTGSTELASWRQWLQKLGLFF